MPEVIDAAAGGSEETPVAVMTECDLAGLGRGRHRRPPSKNSWPLSGGEPSSLHRARETFVDGDGFPGTFLRIAALSRVSDSSK